MIPSNQNLRKKIGLDVCYQILMHEKNYFKLADEYVSLQKIFSRDTLIGKLELWFDMIISPLLMILKSIWDKQPPSMFSLLSLQKCFQLWKDWFRMRVIRSEIHMWIKVVRSIGGPFISSNDAEYHVFVYADAMQRLHDSLLLVSKESTKRL
jgi:hypothetical protein